MKLLDTDTCIGLLKGDDVVVSSWRAGNVRHYNRIEGLAIENWFERIEN